MKKINLVTILIIIAIAGFILSPLEFFKNGLGLVRQIFSPFSSAAQAGSVKAPIVWQTLSELKNLAIENQQLKAQNDKLETRLSHLLEVERENRTLKEEIDLDLSSGEQELIFSKIIARSPSSFNQTIFISAGRKQNVQVGDPVMARGYLIGKVEEVDEHTSQVILTSNHRFLAPVILAESRALGLLRGGLQGIKVEQIPADIKIKEQEMVLISDISKDLPSNLPVGKISGLLSEKSDIFQSATISLPFNPNLLETVLIFKRK